jgi:hypothetical protein
MIKGVHQITPKSTSVFVAAIVLATYTVKLRIILLEHLSVASLKGIGGIAL